ncbi:MAG: TOBE domain-containing protein, partial [Bacteroidota bacterium]
DVILHRGPLGTTSMRNHLTGSVTGIVSLGGPFRVTVDAGFPVVALITKQAFLELDLAVGGPIDLSFKAHAVHLIPLPS